jgi:hypothetical protein
MKNSDFQHQSVDFQNVPEAFRHNEVSHREVPHSVIISNCIAVHYLELYCKTDSDMCELHMSVYVCLM